MKPWSTELGPYRSAGEIVIGLNGELENSEPFIETWSTNEAALNTVIYPT